MPKAWLVPTLPWSVSPTGWLSRPAGSWLIYARRRELHSPWRKPGRVRQALPTLAHLRKNETYRRIGQVGPDFGVSGATAWRYTGETPWSSRPGRPASTRSDRSGRGRLRYRRRHPHPADRITADEPCYSQRHKQHGMNVQATAAPNRHPAQILPRDAWTRPRRRPGPSSQNVLTLADRTYQDADTALPHTQNTTANTPSIATTTTPA